MPNLIHSLDACSLALLYVKFMSNNINMYTIHDCYCVPAPLVSHLIDVIQNIYFKLYSEDIYLEKFDIGIRAKIEEKIKDVIKNNIICYKGKKIKYPDVEEIIYDKYEDEKLKSYTEFNLSSLNNHDSKYIII